ncbi:hypothetical protein M3Y94_00077300 [Aphelenchoides besseyi]|nr:hypothetical protein M3Y94_00077300 [Aphelenchoides besseyi]
MFWDTYYLLEVDFDRSGDYKRHAFNTFKTNTTNSIQDCPLEELTTFLYQPRGEDSDQDDIIFVSPTDVQTAAQNASFKNQRSLGFGIALNHHCHSRIKYTQYYDEKEKNTYVVKDGQERGNDLPRGNVSFYSL